MTSRPRLLNAYVEAGLDYLDGIKSTTRERQMDKLRARLLRKCKWTEYEKGLWTSECPDPLLQPFNPKGEWAFCPYCGGELEVEE